MCVPSDSEAFGRGTLGILDAPSERILSKITCLTVLLATSRSVGFAINKQGSRLR